MHLAGGNGHLNNQANPKGKRETVSASPKDGTAGKKKKDWFG